MTTRYNPQATESKWQKIWADKQSFRAVEDTAAVAVVSDASASGTEQSRQNKAREKYFVMSMFPYPSGRIHIGHVRNYTLGDVVARYKRARGFNVLHPMGWDAFGLPAENAARDRKTHPAIWTHENIKNMRTELVRMGLSIDWDREVTTCDPPPPPPAITNISKNCFWISSRPVLPTARNPGSIGIRSITPCLPTNR